MIIFMQLQNSQDPAKLKEQQEHEQKYLITKARGVAVSNHLLQFMFLTHVRCTDNRIQDTGDWVQTQLTSVPPMQDED